MYLVFHYIFQLDLYQSNCTADPCPDLLSLDCTFQVLHRNEKKNMLINESNSLGLNKDEKKYI